MKKGIVILAGALLATASFTTLAATPVDQDQAQGLQSLGSVSVSNARGSLDDVSCRKKQKRWAPATTALSASKTRATPACGAAPQRFIANPQPYPSIPVAFTGLPVAGFFVQ